MLDTFHFLRPWWLLALVPATVLSFVLFRLADPGRAWRRVIADHLLRHLLVGRERRRRLGPVHLMLIAWLVGTVALAGPSWRREPAPFTDDTAALVIALKVAPSMLAEDVQPSRLARAAHKIRDLLALRAGARTALLVYSGSAHLVMPLTRDERVIELFAEELTPDIMPEEGDAAGDAIRLGGELLAEAAAPGSIVLITDGIPPSEVQALAQGGYDSAPVHVLAVGAGPGAPPPAGGPPAPAIDRAALERASRTLRGSLTVVTPDDRDVERLAALIARSFATVPAEDGGDRWQDAGYWLTPLFALLCLVWARRGWSVEWAAAFLVVLPLGLVGCSESPGDGDVQEVVSSGAWIDWWQTPDQQGQRLLRAGKNADAARRFTDAMWRGVALYRDGQFEAAAASFGQVGGAEGLFNRGGALLLGGKYRDAITAYDGALELEPGWEDAEANRRLARLRLERLEANEPADMTGGQLGADEIVFSDEKSKQSGGDEQVEVGGGGTLSDEELRALWLRQVQTKPADFLRAKFAYQLAVRNRGEEER